MPSNVLFICSKNRLRSPTAEQVFAIWPGIETSSVGINHDAVNPVSPELIQWADIIFVMERVHKTKLSSKFKSYLGKSRVICLDISDDYEFMDLNLIQGVYRSEFNALKHTLSGSKERSMMKLIVDDANDRVIGLHMVGDDAGEVVQGFAVAMKAGATKAIFDSTIGIHPTVAEEFVTMRVADDE